MALVRILGLPRVKTQSPVNLGLLQIDNEVTAIGPADLNPAL